MEPKRRGEWRGAPRGLRKNSGSVIVLLTIALVAILGMAALSVDVGRLLIAAQRAQDVADAAALAGGALLRDPSVALATAQQFVAANNQPGQGPPVTCQYIPGSNQSDILYYPPFSYVPGYGALGPAAKALVVKTHITVPYSFARVLGFTQQEITRRAIVVRAPLGGAPIVPLWVAWTTPYNYGDYQNLLMADGPHYAEIPGSFGWLQLPPEVEARWRDVIAGLYLSDADLEALFCNIGDIVYASTGLSVGQWADALQSRITRGSSGKWSGETFENFSPDNPRILIVPLVTYLSGTGSGARFRIVKFGAFWLESVKASGQPKKIGGRFIRYTLPGAGLEPLSDDTGLFSYRIVG